MPQPNQHDPLPPIEDIAPTIFRLWKDRKTDVYIHDYLKRNVINTSRYGLGFTSYRKIRKEKLGLLGTRQQGHTLLTMHDAMTNVRDRYPRAGARECVSILFHEHSMSISRHLVVNWFRINEPHLIRERKANNLKRRHFWAAGVNDIITVDQHDKWKRYGLALHVGLDPFSGRIHWLKIYWTNNNPKVILSYYLEFVRKNGYIPLVTQSDLGSENYGIAKAHTALRHWHDPSLTGTIQHRWMRHKKNVKPEIAWRQLRGRWTPGFEDTIQIGVNEGWYDPNRPLDVLLFRWLFIPWLQCELDAYADRVNSTAKRADKNKILPHGPPNNIHSDPKEYGSLDFKIHVDPKAVDEVEEQFAPPNDPCFQLVPESFAQWAAEFYQEIGSPALTKNSIWTAYRQMLHKFEHLEEAADLIDEYRTQMLVLEDEDDPIFTAPRGRHLDGGEDEMDDQGNFYLGGVNNGRGLGKYDAHRNELDRLADDDDDLAIDLADDFSDVSDDDINQANMYF